jgi:hypothetical protein
MIPQICIYLYTHEDGQLAILNFKIAAISVYEVHISDTMKEQLSDSTELLGVNVGLKIVQYILKFYTTFNL